jgi:hypothetical protein
MSPKSVNLHLELLARVVPKAHAGTVHEEPCPASLFVLRVNSARLYRLTVRPYKWRGAGQRLSREA